MPEKKTTTVKDQVALLEGIERHWKGYLLQIQINPRCRATRSLSTMPRVPQRS